MARIAGVDLPKNKRLEIALTYIFGIGRSLANRICAALNISPDIKVKDLTDEQISQINAHILANYKVEGDLRREIAANIRRLMEIGCYRGIRHRKGLPVRGQRTRTNARTRRGPRKTVGAVKAAEKRKKEAAKSKSKEK